MANHCATLKTYQPDLILLKAASINPHNKSNIVNIQKNPIKKK